jgi:hypothetical protein
MVGKEEKILLMAKESGIHQDHLDAINQVVQNCYDDIDVNKLSTFQVEDLFLKLRARSVDDFAVIRYQFDEEFDEEGNPLERTFRIPLAEVKVHYPPKVEPHIDLGDGVGMSMKWPSASIHSDPTLFEDGGDVTYRMVAKCIDQIWKDDIMYDPSMEKEEDLVAWLEDLDLKTWDHIKRFLDSMPYLRYEIKYRNSKGDEQSITLTTLSDFFVLD